MSANEQSIRFDELVGAKLRDLRESAFIPQGVLAEAARKRGFPKWSQATVSLVESGKRPLSFREACALRDILDDCLPAERRWSFDLTFAELLNPGQAATLRVADGLELTGPQVNALLGLSNEIDEEE
jgi:hypothetical protein